MDVISWAINAIDTAVSTGKSSPEVGAECPGGSFNGGFVRDPYKSWQPLCLAPLAIEDVEDPVIFGCLLVGFALIGTGVFLLYRKIDKLFTSRKEERLPYMISDVGRAVGVAAQTQTTAMADLGRRLDINKADLGRKMDVNSERVTSLSEVIAGPSRSKNCI